MSNADSLAKASKLLICRPKVFIDADVLIAGSASTRGASHIVLQLSELTVIEGFISLQVKREAERNLQIKLPQALSIFRKLVKSAVEVVADAGIGEITPYLSQANANDASILATACTNRCHYLLTFNVRHYYPKAVTISVLSPGDFLFMLRQQLLSLIPS